MPRINDQAATTSSLTTRNFTRSIRPKLVVSATSAASRPVPIRMRPMRGRLWRGAHEDPPPRREAREQPEKNNRGGDRGAPRYPAKAGEADPRGVLRRAKGRAGEAE